MTTDDVDDPGQMDLFAVATKTVEVVRVPPANQDPEEKPREQVDPKDDPNNPFDAVGLEGVAVVFWDPWAEMTPKVRDEAEFVDRDEQGKLTDE